MCIVSCLIMLCPVPSRFLHQINNSYLEDCYSAGNYSLDLLINGNASQPFNGYFIDIQMTLPASK